MLLCPVFRRGRRQRLRRRRSSARAGCRRRRDVAQWRSGAGGHRLCVAGTVIGGIGAAAIPAGNYDERDQSHNGEAGNPAPDAADILASAQHGIADTRIVKPGIGKTRVAHDESSLVPRRMLSSRKEKTLERHKSCARLGWVYGGGDPGSRDMSSTTPARKEGSHPAPRML